MAIGFGTAARNAAASFTKRRRGNPDPDNVIGERVAQQIINNSSRDIGAYFQQAAASMPPPPPPSFVAGTSPTGQRNPMVDRMVSNAGAALGRRSLPDFSADANVPPGQLHYQTEYPRMFPPVMPDVSMPTLGGPGEGPRRSLDVRMPTLSPDNAGYDLATEQSVMGLPPSVWNLLNPDAKTFPVYEDGSFNVGRPAPIAAPLGPMDRVRNAPAPPTLVPGAPDVMDPELISLLQALGLI